MKYLHYFILFFRLDEVVPTCYTLYPSDFCQNPGLQADWATGCRTKDLYTQGLKQGLTSFRIDAQPLPKWQVFVDPNQGLVV